MEPFYPSRISKRLSKGQQRLASDTSAVGSAAALECGTHVRFEIEVGADNVLIADAAYQTNGCGFMAAAADTLAELIRDKLVTELHGLGWVELTRILEESLGVHPADRQHCITTTIDALRAAFAALRLRRVEEFAGEKALICTCFSVTEDAIEYLITNRGLTTVGAIGKVCNAGTGCGSCQPVIQDMLDAHRPGAA